jgi:hypothetical protein
VTIASIAGGTGSRPRARSGVHRAQLALERDVEQFVAVQA